MEPTRCNHSRGSRARRPTLGPIRCGGSTPTHKPGHKPTSHNDSRPKRMVHRCPNTNRNRSIPNARPNKAAKRQRRPRDASNGHTPAGCTTCRNWPVEYKNLTPIELRCLPKTLPAPGLRGELNWSPTRCSAMPISRKDLGILLSYKNIVPDRRRHDGFNAPDPLG